MTERDTVPSTLYYAPGACSLAVHIVLEWIGAPYEAVADDQHSPSFRAINSAGAVPALRHGNGSILTQAAAILRFLARQHPEAGLLDETTREATAQSDRWSDCLTGDLRPAFFPVFTPQLYTTSRNPADLNAVAAAGLALVDTKMALLDQHLRGRTWMVGSDRSTVDAYTVPMMRWAGAKLPSHLSRCPAVAMHHAHLMQYDAVRRVITAEEPR